jgi:hypothetical protein
MWAQPNVFGGVRAVPVVAGDAVACGCGCAAGGGDQVVALHGMNVISTSRTASNSIAAPPSVETSTPSRCTACIELEPKP